MHWAAIDEKAGVSVPGELRDQLQTLVSGCGIYRLDQAQIALTGSHRVRWLNGMVTNNVRDLKPGRGVYAFVLNPQGHIQADLYAFQQSERLVVETERAQVDKVAAVFNRYIIMDDVKVENLAGKLATIGITGGKSRAALQSISWTKELDGLEFGDSNWNGAQITVVRGDNPLIENYEIWLPAELADEMWKTLLGSKARAVGPEALETLRIICGFPKFGQDIRDRDLPQETGQDRALNFTKGCFIGQEIVERIRSRGSVHRTFTGFQLDGPRPSVPSKIQSEGKEIGEVTSIASLPADRGEQSIALGYVRKEYLGKELTAGEAKLRVAPLPFSEIVRQLSDREAADTLA
jgi:folate-binding protein YgfZ